MRTSLTILMMALFLAFPAAAAEKATLGQVLAAELGIPSQEPFAGITNITWQAFYSSPGASLTLASHSPLGLGEGPDAILAEAAREPFKELLDGFLAFAEEEAVETRKVLSRALASGQPLPEQSLSNSWYASTTYELFRPSGRYVSVLFHHEEFTGGAHGNSTYRAFSFDVQSGAPLALADVFPDEAAALAQLAPRVADGVQAQKALDAPPVEREPGVLDIDMDRILLTPEGMRVVYAPYEMGSFSEGRFIVDIDKNTLLRMGARRDIWQ